MAAFIAEHQNFFIPVITWGGLFILLFVTFSPFLVIRHPYFRPTRWWHIVGAYFFSVLIYVGYIWTSVISYPIIRAFITTWELLGAYDKLDLQLFIHVMAGYPLFIFYSAKLLYGEFTRKRFYWCLFLSIVSYFMLFFAGFYLTAMLAAGVLFEQLN